MGNYAAVKPTKTAKVAQKGTLMLRRSDVMGAVRKYLHHARTAIELAEAESRQQDAAVMESRRRAFYLMQDAVMCMPIFECPDEVTGQ